LIGVVRKIFHLDLDAFYCAVEEQLDPSLAGKPFAVGGRPDQRGVVSSCSYAARMRGVRSAMPTARALKIYPGLILLPGNHRRYGEISRQVMDRLRQWTALVEVISIDEAFLDLSDLPEEQMELTRKLQDDIWDNLGLPCSIGAASNKLVAKIATDYGKSQHKGNGPPKAITIVPVGEEERFLAPLPVSAMWGVGPKTAEMLTAKGFHTIGDLAGKSEEDLVQLMGKLGKELYFRSRGMDDRPVVTEHEAKSISQEVTFARDVTDFKELEGTLRRLSDRVGEHLRRDGLMGKVVKLKLRWHDFTTLTRQLTLPQPTDVGTAIYQAAHTLLEKVWEPATTAVLDHHAAVDQPSKAVRLIGVGMSKFSQPDGQLSFWDGDINRNRRLEETLDDLRQRYGRDAIQRGKTS